MTDKRTISDLALLSEHDAWLRALARRLVKDEDSARDLAQETWLQALQQEPDPSRPIRSWLTTVARRTAQRVSKKDRRRIARERSQPEGDSLPAPEDLLLRAEALRRLTHALTELPDPFRSTLLLRYQEQLSAAEIARRAGEPEGTVRWRLARGRELLKKQLGDDPKERRDLLATVLIPPSAITAKASIVTGGTLMSLKTAGAAATILLLIAAALSVSSPPTPSDLASSAGSSISSVDSATSSPDFSAQANLAVETPNRHEASVDPKRADVATTVKTRRTGRVLTQDGTPIEGAWVIPIDDEDGGSGTDRDESRWPLPSFGFKTDENGDFALSSGAAFAFLDEAWMAGKVGFATSSNGKRAPDGALEFRLSTACVVYGTVREYETLRPISGVHVCFGEQDRLYERGKLLEAVGVCQWQADAPVPIVTDQDGRFRFDGVPTGQAMDIVLWREGRSIQKRPFAHPGGAAPVQFDMFLAQGLDLAIRVVDAESGNPLSDVDLFRGALPLTDSDGRVRVRGIVQETTTVEAQPPGYCRTSLRIDRSRLPTPATIELPVLREIVLEGLLLDPSGKPMPSIRIDVRQDYSNDPVRERLPRLARDDLTLYARPQPRTLRTDADGRFRVGGLKPLSHPALLHVRPPSQPAFFSVPFTVPLDPNDHTPDIVLRMPAPTFIRGQVTNRNAPRVARVTFQTSGVIGANTETDPNGHFEMRVPPGSGELCVQPMSEGRSVLHRQPLHIVEGESRTIDIRLGHVDHVIAGHVVDAKGRPLPDVRVRVEGWGFTSNSDTNGRFELRCKAPTQGSFVITAGRFPIVTITRMIPSNTTDVVIVFPPDGVAALRVRDDATNRIVPGFSVRWRDLENAIEHQYGQPVLNGTTDVNGVTRIELPQGEYEITIDATLFGYPISEPIAIDVRSEDLVREVTEVRLRKQH